MLQIKHICKEYKTGALIQKALDDVSLNLRDNEFVAILGPSGSGKTTLLNIIGGLDRYDSGDLIINGISTKKYKDRDWDSYRNHTIGFVFQSYNLIPHQSVLANVELALTISGIGKDERRERAIKALQEVGLGEQLHKKPNQMSGGQMQRVAIARALINDPDILLADEPTGALDSETSVQVMDLLKEVAKDRLVVMVTHNPELARDYATRIVNLRDGRILSDSDPFLPDMAGMDEPEHKNMGKASMSFLTALSLSFNNLKTKKARTLLTSFAGSIGIIGIALILSLSTGVDRYIATVETETLSQYPLQIQSTGFDFSSMMSDGPAAGVNGGSQDSGDVNVIDMVSSMFSTMDSNDLASLKEYLDSGKSDIDKYTNAIEYSYSVVPQIYRQDENGYRQVNPDKSFDALGFGSSSGSNSMMSSMMSTDVFYQMPENAALYESQYDVKAGRWTEKYNECVVVLSSNGNISDFMLYTLGLRDYQELDDMIQQFINEENVVTPSTKGSYSYEDIMGVTFKLVNASDRYQYDSQYQLWTDKSDDEKYMEELVAAGEDIKIVGVVQPSEDANGLLLSTGIAYPASLTKHVAEEAEKSEIVKQQLSDKTTNVLTGDTFGQSGQNDFDLGSMFSIDQNKMQNAFKIDTDILAEGLSSMDGSSENGSGDGLGSEIDMSDVMSSIEINASPEDMQQLFSALMAGYQEYAVLHPDADYSNLGEDLSQYLNSSEAIQIIRTNIVEIIQANGGLPVSTDQLRQLITDMMAGYQQYAAENGYTDPDRFDEYLMEYLGTAEAEGIIQRWAGEVFGDMSDFEITQDQMNKLASDIAAGYVDYASKNGLADPSKIGEHFSEYLGTEQAKQLLYQELASMVDTRGMSNKLMAQMEDAMTVMMEGAAEQLAGNMQKAISIDPEAFAQAFTMNMSSDEFTQLMMSRNSAENATYENNMKNLGYVDFDTPSLINIYPKDFESKEQVVNILDEYNRQMEAEGKDEQVITYTDMVGTLMSSVTDIIDIISYVLIAFVAISLVVSSIMIGVITYISVLERQKEIGILRAIGASKGNISQVFNAETFIIGLCAGLMGILITELILIPGNALIHHLAGTNNISAVLPTVPAVILVLLSVVLTLIGGIIPSRKAAKSDPVTALRNE